MLTQQRNPASAPVWPRSLLTVPPDVVPRLDAVFDAGSPVQIAFALLVSAYAHVLHAYYKPFVDVSAHRLQHFSLFTTTFVFTIAMLLKVDAFADGRSSAETKAVVDWLGVVLVVLCGSFIVTTVLLGVRNTVGAVRDRLRLRLVRRNKAVTHLLPASVVQASTGPRGGWKGAESRDDGHGDGDGDGESKSFEMKWRDNPLSPKSAAERRRSAGRRGGFKARLRQDGAAAPMSEPPGLRYVKGVSGRRAGTGQTQTIGRGAPLAAPASRDDRAADSQPVTAQQRRVRENRNQGRGRYAGSSCPAAAKPPQPAHSDNCAASSAAASSSREPAAHHDREELPDGWRLERSDASDRNYYWHAATHTAVWSEEEIRAFESCDAPLPEGWTMHREVRPDGARGPIYFWLASENKASWVNPST